MFQVQHTLISDDIAFAKFACKISACKGACCVVGDAGAPVERSEQTVLKKAYNLLENELPQNARDAVREKGLISMSKSGLELTCVGTAECVFVIYDQFQNATCSIQKAYYEGRFNWEKPLSCHLFPIRILSVGSVDFLNFEFVPEICTPGAENGSESNIYLADYLETPLTRKYGKQWYQEFLAACIYMRENYPAGVVA